MQKAIQLALKAQYQTEPNPIVGSLLADSEGNILSTGYHKKAGEAHAEVMALQAYTTVPDNTTLYVTLEPCSHHGKTPPCVDLIREKKVKRVVVGCQDPNPQVAGRGIRILRDSGVEVIIGILEQQCRDLNPVFNKHIVTKMPFVTMKAATSLDGKIAMPTGESKWITGEAARRRGHQLRSQHQAIAVGSKTLLQDNPQLTNRVSPQDRQPIRIAFSGSGKLSQDLFFIRNRETRRIVVTGSQIDDQEAKLLEAEGVQLLVSDTPKPEIKWALKKLYEEGICSLLLEGGAELATSFIKEKMVDQLALFLSGKVIASPTAPSWCGNLGIERLADVPQIHFTAIEQLEEDLLITGTF